VHPILFELGPVSLKSYGLMLAISILTGIYLAKRQAKKEGIEPKEVETISFWLAVSGIFGARFLYTFVENGSYYWRHPIEFFYLQTGGISFFGALYTVVPTLWFLCWKKKLSFLQLADIFAPVLSLGLGITKIGCFLAGCCYGTVCDLPWAITFTNPQGLAQPKGVPLHPAQLYEAVSWISLYFILVWLRKYRKVPGEIFLLFVITFGIGRALLEEFRGDSIHVKGLTSYQWMSIPVVLLGIIAWVYLRKRKKKERSK